MLMQNSVEGRFPYLDHRVIEFANRLDPRIKMKVLEEKYILKRAMAAELPTEILHRFKQPYRAPDILAFFSTKTRDYVRERLSDRAILESGYFDTRAVARLVRKIESGRSVSNRDNMALVGILSTQIWHEQFVAGHGRMPKLTRMQSGPRTTLLNTTGP